MLITCSALGNLITFLADAQLMLDVESLSKFLFGEESYVAIQSIEGAGIFREESINQITWNLYIPTEMIEKGVIRENVNIKRKKLKSLRKVWGL